MDARRRELDPGGVACPADSNVLVGHRRLAANQIPKEHAHDAQIPPHRGRARPACRPSARSPSTCTCRRCRRSARPRRQHRRRADEPDGVLPVDGLRPDRRRPDLRHGRPQAAALSRPGAVRGRRHRLGAGAEHRMADRLPLHPGARRLRRHGGAARHRARPAHRHRSGAADVAADAGVQRVADPGAADRQPGHRGVRLARRVLGGDGRGAARHGPAGHRASRRRGRPSIASTARSAARSPATGSCWATATSSA